MLLCLFKELTDKTVVRKKEISHPRLKSRSSANFFTNHATSTSAFGTASIRQKSA